MVKREATQAQSASRNLASLVLIFLRIGPKSQYFTLGLYILVYTYLTLEFVDLLPYHVQEKNLSVSKLRMSLGETDMTTNNRPLFTVRYL